MRAAFLDLDRALTVGPVAAAARRFFRGRSGGPPLPPLSEFRLRLRRQAKALIAAHHWRGHVVVLLTDGSAEWAAMAAEELDADGMLTRPESEVERDLRGALDLRPSSGPNAHYAQRAAEVALHPWRSGAVTRFCLRYNFAAGASFGYGALDDDWLWLETLGHPAAAHPSGKLRRRALVAGWPILNLNRRSDLPTPPSLDFGSAPPCVTLT